MGQAEDLAEELRTLARASSAIRADKSKIDRLRGVVGSLDQPATLDDLHRSIAAAVATLSSRKADAALILFGEDDRRWQRNLTERRREAADVLGVGDATFRRKQANGLSPYDELAIEVAQALLDQRGDDAPAPPPPEPASTPQRRGMVAVAAVATVAVIGLVGWALSAGDDSPETTTPDTTSTSTSTSSTSTTTTTEAPTTTAEELQPTPCEFEVGKPTTAEAGTDARREAFVAAFEANGGEAALGCPVEAVNQRGGLYWQEVRRHATARGGLLGLPDGTALYLNAGQWRSYIRIGGGDGSLSPTWGGLPTGEVTETTDGWSLELDAPVEMYAESIDGSYFWIPGSVVALWDEEGRSDGAYGRIASSPYRVADGIRQDFEHGYFLLTTEGDLTWNELDDPASELPAPEELRGRIIGAFDGTGWLIDDELRRWWIVDPEHWYCAGADLNSAGGPVSGSAIASLEYGGLLPCPANEAGFNPMGGSTSRKVYCQSEVQDGARETRHGEGHGCTDGENTVPIDLDALCAWQFGEGAIGIYAPSDPGSWRCESAELR